MNLEPFDVKGQFPLSQSYLMTIYIYVETNSIVKILRRKIPSFQQNARRSNGRKVEVPKLGQLHQIVLLAWVEISVEIVSVHHIEFLVNVELTWIQGPKSPSKSS